MENVAPTYPVKAPSAPSAATALCPTQRPQPRPLPQPNLCPTNQSSPKRRLPRRHRHLPLHMHPAGGHSLRKPCLVANLPPPTSPPRRCSRRQLPNNPRRSPLPCGRNRLPLQATAHSPKQVRYRHKTPQAVPLAPIKFPGGSLPSRGRKPNRRCKQIICPPARRQPSPRRRPKSAAKVLPS